MPRKQRQTRQLQVEGKLSNSLVLNRYLLSLFGASSLEALSEHLKDPVLEGWDENNVSYSQRACAAVVCNQRADRGDVVGL